MRPDVTTLRVSADQLRAGDVLRPTNRTVLCAGLTIDTPARKITVELQQRNRRRRQHFGAATEVIIDREES